MMVVVMMYNQDYVDQMDVDVKHLKMVVGNKVVENPIHLDLLIDQNYWIYCLNWQNDLIDPRLKMMHRNLDFSLFYVWNMASQFTCQEFSAR